MFGGLAIGFAKLAKPSNVAQGRPQDARDSDKKFRRRDVRRPR